MSKLRLSTVMGNYGRMCPLIDGGIQIDGMDPVSILQDPEKISFRAFCHADYDICELSSGSYSVKMTAGTPPYIAVPVFPLRAFHYSSIYMRAGHGINRPEDLRGKRIGVPEYQLTANAQAYMFLGEGYSVKASDIRWVHGGYEDPTRVEKISLKLPEGVILENTSEGETISNLLAEGEIDGVVGPRAPSCFDRGYPQVKYLFNDPQKSTVEWYEHHKLFSIMYTLGIRKTLAEQHPWPPGAMTEAFEHLKEVAFARLNDTSATKVTLPFIEDQLRNARRLMGHGF